MGEGAQDSGTIGTTDAKKPSMYRVTQPPRYFSRIDELNDILRRLNEFRSHQGVKVISLYGSGGIGKVPVRIACDDRRALRWDKSVSSPRLTPAVDNDGPQAGRVHQHMHRRHGGNV